VILLESRETIAQRVDAILKRLVLARGRDDAASQTHSFWNAIVIARQPAEVKCSRSRGTT